jgi:seryl-tRNA synthetase
MLDLKFIRDNSDLVRQNTANKNESADIDRILELDEKRRSIIQEADQLKNQRNTVSSEIAVLKKNKQNADDKIQAMKEVSDRIKQLDDELRSAEEELEQALLKVPNMTDNSVPVGRSAEDNPEMRRWGKIYEGAPKKNHIEISKIFGILDFERGAKVSGAGFAYYVGKGAALERALINYMLDYHISNHGYKELMPPLMVNPASMRGTGQLPKMVEDMYYAEKDNLYLIPTAEVPITNFYNNEVLKGEDMTVKMCGYTPCFRREAGSYGKESRGFLRVHQFNKVELVKFSMPENSYDELESLVVNVETILKNLEIPYRVILLCTGDTSFSSAKTYDIETWSPGEQKWLEASSCSNFEDFQARRANIRFKRTPTGKPEFVHTLNGSGLATSRLMVSMLEHYYEEENNRIRVPEALRPYTRFDYIEA